MSEVTPLDSDLTSAETPSMSLESSLIVDNLSLFYGDSQALSDINMEIAKKQVTAFIGPSGCGKSTLLRCFNRMNDLIDGVSIKLI